MRSTVLKTVAVGAAVLGLATGCTSSGKDKATPSGSTSGSPSASASTKSSPLVQNSLPKSVANSVTARKNVKPTKCAAVPGGWGAEGTATNPGTTPVTYTITVFFTTTSATALDFATTKVTVPAGKTENWSASKKFAAQATMLCPIPGVTVS